MAEHDPNKKINYIVNFFMDMCDAPLQLYVRSLLPALKEALITYYQVDLVQVFTAWVRPHGPFKPLRGHGHGPLVRPEDPHEPHGREPKGRKRTWSRIAKKFISFDPWDYLGEHLPFHEELHGRSVTPGVHYLWSFYNVEQRVQNWIMIYEIVEQGFYKTLGGVADSVYCREQYRPWMTASAVDDANIPLVQPCPVNFSHIVKIRHFIYAAGNTATCIGPGIIGNFSAKCTSRGTVAPGEPIGRLAIQVDDGPMEYSGYFMNEGDVQQVTATSHGSTVRFFTVGSGIWFIGECEYNAIGMSNYIDYIDGPF
jgi:hypothetical protein